MYAIFDKDSNLLMYMDICTTLANRMFNGWVKCYTADPKVIEYVGKYGREGRYLVDYENLLFTIAH